MIKLRDYQLDAHKQIVECFRKNQKTLLVMATGSGKSKTVVSFVEKYNKHYIFILVVKNRKLVNQLANDCRFFNLDYGVYMAAHDDFDPSRPNQVCSIDTIHTRGGYPHINSPKPLVLIIDEADQSKSSTYQSMINKYLNRENERTFLLGMTATPYNCLSHFDTYINPITPKQLLEQGFLVDFEYVIPKNSVDYSDITISKGEFSTKQAVSKFDNPHMIKSNFESWLEYGENRQTLVFCMNKKHAENFCNFVNNFYGKEMAKFVYDKTSDEDREQIFSEFNSGIIRFLVNIRIITRGVDLPIIGCILDICCTLNVNLHIQKLGRGSRINDFYKNCIVIDPAKNVIHNGHFYQEREISLTEEFKRNKSTLDSFEIKVCEKCFRAAEKSKFKNNICPYCGAGNKPEKKKKVSKYMKKKLFMEKATPREIENQQMINEFKKILWKKKNLGTKYRNNIAREMSQFYLVKKYGLEKVKRISKAISLLPKIVRRFE